LPPVTVEEPEEQTLPVILASPHSGRRYDPGFLAQSRLSPRALRRSEDSFVDEIVADGPRRGMPAIQAQFPRAYIDPNREPFELDPEMFDEPLPDYANTRSPRVAAGLGTIARIVAQGQEIYGGPLTLDDAMARIRTCYEPYHAALRGLIERTRQRFGHCILLDMHSMPSITPGQEARPPVVDMVLGDHYGAACAFAVTEAAATMLRRWGFRLSRNAPYAGGFTTRHYGQPRAGVHVLQIEISRALYMDETTLTRRPSLTALRRRVGELAEHLGRIDPQVLHIPMAAE
jgi:N-formylglutamate amidohydrolase